MKKRPLGPMAREALKRALAATIEQGAPSDRAITEELNRVHLEDKAERQAIRTHLTAILFSRARLAWWLKRLKIEESPACLFAAHAIITRAAPPSDVIRDWFSSEEPSPPSALAALQGENLENAGQDDLTRLECPKAYAEGLKRAFGPRFAEEMMAMRASAPPHFRVNTLKTTREGAVKALRAEDIAVRLGRLSPWSLIGSGEEDIAATAAFKNGLIEAQDEASQIAALVVDAKPGEKILDLCAGAGGKALALAAAMENKGLLIACDVSEGRLRRARQRAARAGVSNITYRLLDTQGRKWLKRQDGRFDAVILDAPCTGTGAWRRNPDARWSRQDGDLASLTARQDQLLASARRALKPGGRLIYVTCSFLREENEDRIAALLAAHPDLKQEDFRISPLIPDAIRPKAGPDLRLTPAQHGTDGFFISRLRRDSVTSQTQNM
ncbi:MAG: RsmB/NOP family class I SAM-dependent RNA methyltransferase [Alphaproteobacteria bacterium]|nr:RsmB/NOP family class I SAM-dependent RNA methyltransferase [Alphaproteobacteria bacterium]